MSGLLLDEGSEAVILQELRPTTTSGFPFSDGSGAPAIVTILYKDQTFRFAMDYIRKTTVSYLNPQAVNHLPKAVRNAALAEACRSYNNWLTTHVDSTWFAKNQEMYKEAFLNP